ncbi:MAG: protein kinase [Bacteroides sp.]|nr:protein kinase [Bacteroides sp.]MCM1096273.1 protein kinase [Terasakiella sp.]
MSEYDKPGTGTAIPPAAGTGTMVPPAAGTGTAIPPSAGTGTAIPGATTVTAGATSGMIPEYDEYVIRGIRYRVCPQQTAKTLGKRSGEAKIFVVDNGGRLFVLKLYRPGHSPNHAILDQVQQAKGGFIIDLYDHGRWDDPRHPGITLDYEVMAYAPHGSLAEIRLKGDEKRFRDVARRMAFCIKQCHDRHILHRDIKPENFLFTDAARTTFVITDFGIARSISGDGPVKVDTAKSSYFVSPEGSMSSKDRTTYVDRPTDYYSMGMTLLALWLGVDRFYKLFPYDRLEELDRLKLNNKVIHEIRDELGDMSAHSRSLLERLLEAGDQSRAGFDDIRRWCEGETLKTGAAAEAARSGDFEVIFDETKGKVARSREELAAMMLADRAFAKSFLYRGMARAALQAKYPRLAAEIDDIAQRLYPRPDEQETGVFAACLILDPSLPFTGVDGKPCRTPSEIAHEIANHVVHYSTALARKASPLWAYLRVHGDAVKDFPEKYQPVIARAGIDGLFALCLGLDPTTQLTDRRGPITTLKRLSEHIWTDRATTTKRLTNPDDKIYTYMATFGPNAARLAATYPARIRKEGEQGVYALCLELDKDLAYTGKSGKSITNVKQMADELWDHFSTYRGELADPSHRLWQYMRTWGDSWRRIADTYPALLGKRYDDYGFKLIYLLDPSKPFVVQNPESRKWVNVKTFDDMVAYIADNGTTDPTLESLSDECFVAWLMGSPREADRKRGALVEQMVKQLGAASRKQGFYILYSITPELGYFLRKGERMTPAQIAEYMDSKGPDAPICRLLKSPGTFAGSRLHQFMRARKMQSYIDGINKIIDVPANIAAHKSAPYNERIALYKVIDFMGHRPTYHVTSTRSTVRSLDDVKRLDPKTRDWAINRGMADYLTIFFHEAKGAKFTFDKYKQYYYYIANMCPGYDGLQRSADARARVDSARGRRDKAWQSLRRTAMITTLLCMIPMILTVLWMIYTSFTGDRAALEEAFTTIGGYLAIGGAIIGVIGGLEGGIFGAVIGGLAGYWIPAMIFALLSSVAPWVLSALVVAGAVYCIRKMRVDNDDPHIPTGNAYATLCEQADLLAICETFGTTSAAFGSLSRVDPCVTFDKSRDAALSQRKRVRRGAIGMVILTAVTAAIGISLYKTVDNIESAPAEATVTVVPADMPGRWTGTFHGRDAEMNLELDGIAVTGTVTIQYSTPMTQQVHGSLDYGMLTLEVEGSAGAKYVGTAAEGDDAYTYTGMYSNPSKGTRHQFSFSKHIHDGLQ